MTSPSLPDVLIIGVRKAGTGALRHFLQLHPDIVIARKEMHFFDFQANYAHGLKAYARLLPRKTRTDQLLLEKTPAYFIAPGAARRIRDSVPDVKMLLIVREPVTRMISEYVHFDVGTGGLNENTVPFQVSL